MDEKFRGSFLEKLKTLGVQVGTDLKTPIKKPKSNFPIKDVIDGYEKKTHFGSTFVAEILFPIDTYHGNIQLFEIKDLEMIYRWAKLPPDTSPNIEHILFLDTETSSLVGGAGTFVFMVGLGFFNKDDFKVIQLFLEDPDNESPFLLALEELVAGFDTLVTFNGKSFDIPMLRNRYHLYKFPNPFDSFNHIDLLHLARRIWKNRLPSCRLGDLERDILNFKRSEEEIPGWLVPQIYHDYLFSSDARPLAGVFYHNQYDIVSMAALVTELSIMFTDPYNVTDQNDLISVGKLFEDLSMNSTAQEIYEHCSKFNLTKEQEISLMLRAARLHNRLTEFDQAIDFWSKAVEMGSIDACIEISKLYEHRIKNLECALLYALRGMEHMDSSPKAIVRYERNDLIKRIARIQGKIKHKQKDQ